MLYKMTHALQMESSDETLPHDKSTAGQSLKVLNACERKSPVVFN